METGRDHVKAFFSGACQPGLGGFGDLDLVSLRPRLRCLQSGQTHPIHHDHRLGYAVVSVEKTVVQGMPDVNRISRSHVEKQNHTLRMHCRRLTRLTNAFSKKVENFEAAVSLNFAYYNFGKTHGALRCTPAQTAGVEQSAWTVAELVERCGE